MLRTLWGMLCLFKQYMYWMFAAALLVTAEATLKPYFIKLIIDTLVACHPDQLICVWNLLFYPVSAYIFLSFISYIGYGTWWYVNNIRYTPQVRTHLSLWGVEQLMQYPYALFQKHLSGMLSQKVQDLVRAVPDLVEIVIMRFVVLTICLVIGFFTLAQASLVFGFISASWLIIFLCVRWWTTPYLVELAARWAHMGAIVPGRVVDWVTNSASVIILGRYKHERERVQEACQNAIDADVTQQWANFWVSSLLGVWTMVFVILNLMLLLHFYQNKWISAGDFALILMLNNVIIQQAWNMSSDCTRFVRLLGYVQQAIDTLKQCNQPKFLDQPWLEEPVRPAWLHDTSIVLRDVTFRYPTSTEDILKGVSLRIKSGQKIGIVGYSGAGKSSLIHVLLRLFEVQSGHMSLCGYDAQSLDERQWRTLIGFVPQDPSLFNRTIMENIRYGRLDASDEDVIAAAKRAHAHDFIKHVPDGYNVLVGERGMKLSGGQRQRIALARAFLQDAPVIVLDEATSQLDSVTEDYIQNGLWGAVQGKTTIVVAHRLSTLMHMDRIIVFNDGHIVEDGSHHTLLEKKGLYATLWYTQVGGFLKDAHA